MVGVRADGFTTSVGLSFVTTEPGTLTRAETLGMDEGLRGHPQEYVTLQIGSMICSTETLPHMVSLTSAERRH